MEQLNSCPLCQSDRHRTISRTKDFSEKSDQLFRFSQCLDCQVIFLAERPPQEEIGEYYGDSYGPYKAEYHWLAERFVRRRTVQELNLFRAYNPGANSLLEIGASWGKYIRAARDYGNFQVTGVELSRKMCRIGEELGLDLREGDLLEQGFPAEDFDVVVMNHVIEHLYHPQQTLREIFRISRPGGLVLIKTPNAASLERAVFGRYWWPYETPRHLFIFSEATLRNLLEHVGFQIVKISYEKTPNNLISSIKNYLIDREYPLQVRNFFDIKNPVLLAAFLPFSCLLGIFQTSGRMVVLARKPG